MKIAETEMHALSIEFENDQMKDVTDGRTADSVGEMQILLWPWTS